MKRIFHTFSFSLMLSGSVFGQSSAFGKANALLLENSLAASGTSTRESIHKTSADALNGTVRNNTLQFWLDQLAKDPDNANLNYKTGLCYFFTADQQLRSLPYFRKAAQHVSSSYDFMNEKETSASPSTYYFLASAYMEKNQPDSALKYFALYQDQYAERALSTEREISMCINAREGAKNPRNVQISNFGNVVNSPYTESNPVMKLDNKLLFFSSNRPGADTANVGNADIYYTVRNDAGGWSNPLPFEHNTAYHEVPLYLTPNGDVLYLRRVQNDHADIYRSELVNNTWTKPQPLKEINTEFNETGFTMTGDGKTIYISSDRYKAGKYELFRIVKNSKGKWSLPERLPSGINTPYNEISPYVSPDGSALFYSSDGSSKKGMGSFDVYYSQLGSDGKWSEPASMGYPINKMRADVNYYVSSDDKRFYATLTDDNSYDIFMIEGGGFDFESIAAGTDVITVTNEMGVTQVMETEKKVEKEVEVTQAVETIVEKEKEVEVIKTIEEEKDKEVPLASDANLLDEHLGRKDVKVSDVNVENLTPEERAALVEKVKDYLAQQLKANESVKFKVVYFDFNKSNLNLLSLNELKLLVEFLGEHPETKIEIAGHGDNKGSWETNLQLSNKRAKEVYDFLITNRVSPDRMFFYGKGSAVPIAPNDTEENRSQNRRVEVFILK